MEDHKQKEMKHAMMMKKLAMEEMSSEERKQAMKGALKKVK